ncbi:IS66 family insertion sequence element accessory protein TnpB [Acerihabitans sp. TG2]|uniref:IS66 family insertion sequence element accessory protein TnpA n=2 Tax=Acerihabitans sp. TG2 TaxID=3096008 RepID=UPI002B23B4B6|nr:IS66 family insertion sequence element accessory protein TnpB [Acerihabitans sp. TG2]MEA9391313.1 IS66 family insertion sequence element accessory protein TnpB [Acerihabitans sp. TG2]
MKSQQRAEHWREQITAWQASGLSGQVFCQQQQLTYHQFVYWRQKYCTDNPTQARAPGFAKVTADITHADTPTELTLSLPNGLVITGLNNSNVTLLGAILRQL